MKKSKSQRSKMYDPMNRISNLPVYRNDASLALTETKSVEFSVPLVV